MAEVSYNIPQELPDASKLLEAAECMAAIRDGTAREEALLTVFKLVDGVLAAPEDPKKRRVRKANEVFHRKVGRHPSALDFLRGVGFVEAEDPDSTGDVVLSMPVAYLSRLTDAHHTLALVAQQVGIVAPTLPNSGFNPYRSDLQKTDASKSSSAAEAWREKTDRLHNEVKELEQERQCKVEAAPSVELRPVAFWFSAGRRLDDVIRETADNLDDPITDNALLKQIASASAKAAGSKANANFQSADKRRLADLSSRSRVPQTCVLRVICPDKSVLQVNFRAGDTGEHVMAMVGPLFSPHVRKAGWFMYQSPPLKRLAPKETLCAAGLTPGANVYLGFEGTKPDGPYLSASLVSQLGPSPHQGLHGATADVPPSGECPNWGEGMSLDGKACASGAMSPTPRATSFKTGEHLPGNTNANPKWFRAQTPAAAGGAVSESSTCTGGPSIPGADGEPALQDEEVSPLGFFSCMSSWCTVTKSKNQQASH